MHPTELGAVERSTIGKDVNATAQKARRIVSQVWAPITLFVGALLVYSLTIATELVNTDAFSASVSAWRIATTGHPWMDGVDTSLLHGSSLPNTWLIEGTGGHLVYNRMPGVVWVATPFYWLLNNDHDPSQFTLVPGGIAAAAFTAGAVVLMFLAVRRHVSLTLALTAALVFAFATPTWSVSANSLWTHPVTQFALAGAAWSLSRKRWWTAGMFIGIGMLARPHLALVAAVVGLGMAWSRRDARMAFRVGLPTLLSLCLLLGWNHSVFGSWSLSGGYGDYVTQNLGNVSPGAIDTLVNYLGFFVAPDRGLLIWTPLIVLLLPALVRSWRTLPDWTRWLVVGGVLYAVVQLKVNSFAGGDGYYGYRHALELMTCLTPALVLSLAKVGRVARLLAPPVIGLQFAAITLGATSEGFFVLIDNVWKDNSFWLALRDQPIVTGIFAGFFMLGGVAASVLLHRRASTTGSLRPRES